MTALTWHEATKRRYKHGVDRVAFAIIDPKLGTYGKPIPWNGVVDIKKTPDGGDTSTSFADNIAYASRQAAKTYKVSIECFDYPDEFREAIGQLAVKGHGYASNQISKRFGLFWFSAFGNGLSEQASDAFTVAFSLATKEPEITDNTDSEDNTDLQTITFECDASTVPMPDVDKPLPYFDIDSTDDAVFKKVSEAYIGTGNAEPKFLSPSELAQQLA